ncbi:hypothetical protein HALDL1_04385 [Halobacterium sp. DL1]|jgi:quercetin dioxygenase-like cupin family protein|nr:hypothetical protein HALDL1_04385 [Halobacterium sp. DL1]
MAENTDRPLPNVTNLTDGVDIVHNVYDQPGVDTAEGRVGMLLQGEDVQSQFIEMPGGLYMDEHAHETESIIVTLRGEWVLCARGEREHVTAGDVFWFGPGVPTGYEVPFDDDAFILIFKGTKTENSPEEFVSYLQNEVPGLVEEEREDGAVFSFEELDDDHAAVEFARGLDGATYPE